MHTLYKHICSFFVGYLTNKLRIIWTFSGEFVFYLSVRFFRLQFLAFLSGTTKRIHLFQNTVFIFVAYFLDVGGSGVGGSASSFSGRFHCAAVTSVISISCQTRKPTTCRAVDFPKNVKESMRVGKRWGGGRKELGNQMFVSFHYMFTFVWGAPLTQIAIKRPKIVCLGQMKLAT